MPLMQTSNGDGNFRVYCKFNSKAGRWYTREDKQDGEEYEIQNMTAVWDMENIRTGWFLFAAGVAPIKQFDPSLTQAAASPGDGAKRGFEVVMFSDKNLGGVREFSSTANTVIEAINTLYDKWEAAPEKAAGKLPVVKCTKVTPVTTKHGTNYQPHFDIVSWTDRPPELMDAPTEKAAPAESKPASKPASKHLPPPADDNDVEF